jgi:dissimilatory sulfite reductase (desulfoviridin) alpha/beta subunit
MLALAADCGLGPRGAARQEFHKCTGCGACVEVCKENAIQLSEESDNPIINSEKCLSCGQCISVCPVGVFEAETKGYRIQVGGKLGRRPQLARELEGIYSRDKRSDRGSLPRSLSDTVWKRRFGRS